MFYVFKKNQVILFLALIFLVVTAVSLSVYGVDNDVSLCVKFIKNLGYTPEESPFDTADIEIPEGFGKVYENYNELNKEAGFDLTHLRGLTVKRYSFRLKGEDSLYANILIYENKICGGDICNPALSGFMLPLNPKQ